MRTERITIACAAAALLAACGGTEGAPPPAADPATTTAPTVASGTVTGLGATLAVDGVEYAVTGATVSEDTDPADPVAGSLGDLQLGQQVDASLDSSCHLTHVAIGATVAGLVDPGSIDTAAGRFAVLGQPVAVTASGRDATLFVGAPGAGALAAGRLVKVHGPVDAQGVIRARLVVVFPEGTPLVQRVRGKVTAADAAARTFRLGGLTVAWGAARVLPAGAAVEDGKIVVVFSRTPATGAPSALTLTAGTVRVQHERSREERSREDVVVRIGGPITSVTPVAGRAVPDFTLGGLRVDAAKATLAKGTRATALVVGAVVRVEGTVAGGVLAAREIAVVAEEIERRVVITGQVSSFEGPASFVVRGTSIDASSATFTGGASAAQLADGVMVTVLGHVSGSGVVAESITIHLPPPRAEVVLTGPVADLEPASSASTATTFELLGIHVRLDPDVSWTGGTAADLADGVPVQVRGTFDGAVLRATAVRFLATGPAVPVRVHLGGVVSAVTADGFILNNTTVAVGATTEVVNGPVAAGDRVLVVAQRVAGGALAAVRVEVLPGGPRPWPCSAAADAGAGAGDRCDGAPRGTVQLVGPISAVAGAKFKVDAQVVDASTATFEPSGASSADLAVGRVVAVRGTSAKGVVTAAEVRFLQ